MVQILLDFDSQEFPELLIDQRMVGASETYLNHRVASILGNGESKDWNYIFSFVLLKIRDTDRLNKSNYPIVPSRPQVLSAERMKLISIAIAGNDVVIAEQPTLALCRLMMEAIGVYYGFLKISSPQWSDIIDKFPYDEVESFNYPPPVGNVFHSPFGEPLDIPEDW